MTSILKTPIQPVFELPVFFLHPVLDIAIWRFADEGDYGIVEALCAKYANLYQYCSKCGYFVANLIL